MKINTTPHILQKGNAVSEYEGLCPIGGRAEASIFAHSALVFIPWACPSVGNGQGQGPGFASRLCALGKLISLHSALLSVSWDDGDNGT